MKKNKLYTLIFYIAFLLISPIIAYSDVSGCCINPQLPPTAAAICQGDILRDSECCNNAYLSDGTEPGPTTYSECVNDYFAEGDSTCTSAKIGNKCDTGCCCDSYSVKYRTECEVSFVPGETNCLTACPSTECGDGIDNDNDGCVDTGDNDCTSSTDNSESGSSCGVVTGCSSSSYTPQLSSLQITPVRGEKTFTLSWTDECAATATSYDIARCSGSGCTSYTTITTSTTNYFVDSDSNLKWDTAYRYKVTAHYAIPTATPIIEGEANLGNLECWKKDNNYYFCISSAYYDAEPFASYLSSNYLNKDSSKYNKAYSCSENNVLTAYGTSCSSGTVCVVKDNAPQCYTESECKVESGNPFGLYYTQTACEYGNYCFFDKSQSQVDSCYKCDTAMSCYDYKSEETCGRDNCNIGNCEWHDTISALGIGVCASKIKSNCEWCNKKGTDGMENLNVYNEIFDRCTETKSGALEIDVAEGQDYLCYYKDGTSLACENVICQDYISETDCGSGNRAHDGTNKITSLSSDACSIGVCQWYSGESAAKCRKNADASASTNTEADCSVGDSSCEKDYFKPDTTITPEITRGIYKKLTITIDDNTTKNVKAASLTNYKTYFCIYPDGGTTCGSDGHNYTSYTTKLNLIISNLNMYEDGNPSKNWTLTEGLNKIKYYSQDPSKNIGLVKEITIEAHASTTGPAVANATILNGNLIGGTATSTDGDTIISGLFYTNDASPAISVKFYESTSAANAVITSQETGQPKSLSITSSSDKKTIDFTLPTGTADLTQGTYTFKLDAADVKNNNNNVYREKNYSFSFVVDTAVNSFNITPQDGASLTSSQVLVKFNFDESAKLSSATLNGEDIKANFSSDYAQSFSKTFNLSDSLYTLTVYAEDRAGNQISGPSAFTVNALSTRIELTNPIYGVSPLYTFDITVKTDNIVECRYYFDISGTSPPTLPSGFQDYRAFDATNGINHTISGFNKIPAGDISTHDFYAACNDPVWGISSKRFGLSVDTTPPNIIKTYAFPDPVIEQSFNTTLTVETDDNTTCKYDEDNVDYDYMDHSFPIYSQQAFRTKNEQPIHVEAEGSYNYYTACENLAGLKSNTKRINFSVNLGIGITLTDHTERYSSINSITLSVETNKNAYCYYSTTGTTNWQWLGNSSKTQNHNQLLTNLADGSYTYYAKCNTGSGGEEKTTTINFTIDTTKPNMTYVNDTNTYLPSNFEFTCNTDKLLVKWLAKEDYSPIGYYSYSLLKSANNNVVVNWSSDDRGGEWIWINSLSLTNGTKYYFKTKAFNILDLESNSMGSDGITINTALCGPACNNTKDNCCNAIIDEPPVCDPDCNEMNNIPVDPDCNDCTPAEGDCCDMLPNNGCDSDCMAGADPDCIPQCTVDGQCDTANNKWCDNGWWGNNTESTKGETYCSNCAGKDPDCGVVCTTNNACDTSSQKWCKNGNWTSQDYCSNCAISDPSCPQCSDGECDTEKQKWCDSDRWSVIGYCNECSYVDASCDESCTNNACDTTNKKWCEGGTWSDVNYCENCVSEDSTCLGVSCTNNACDTTNKKWCSNGKWNESDYCARCSNQDSSCAATCTGSECDQSRNRWCNSGVWDTFNYCEHCKDSDCPGTCTNNACDATNNKWCSSGAWTADDYCEKCGNKDSDCYAQCENGNCDISSDKWCSNGIWAMQDYCNHCALEDSECAATCAHGDCYLNTELWCNNGAWTNQSYCEYCEEEDSDCLPDCLNTDDDCCNPANDNSCDSDCGQGADPNCNNCTSAANDCCNPSSDAACDTDCVAGLDPDCSTNCRSSGSCPVGYSCIYNADCESGYCNENKKCAAVSCSDNIKNGNETDKDCGGSCSKCKNSKSCSKDSDCESGNCNYGVCKEMDKCSDSQLSPGETDKDCGGVCPAKCAEGEYCDVDDDCESSLKCISAICSSKGMETGADTDGDGMPDDWEIANGLDPNNPDDANMDNDGDGLSNIEEYRILNTWSRSTNPRDKDTDGDKFADLKEIKAGTDPTSAEDYPKSGKWSIFFLILGILVLLGGGGYITYMQVIKPRMEEEKLPPPVIMPQRAARPVARQAIKPKEITQTEGRLAELIKKKKEEKIEQRKKLFESFKPEEGKEQIKKPEEKIEKKEEQKPEKPAPEKPLKKAEKKAGAIEKLKKLEKEKPKREVFEELRKIAKKKK